MIKITRQRTGKKMGKVSSQLHKDLTRLWDDSAREFLLTAANTVRRDTGMSGGSILPAARKLKMYTAAMAAISRGRTSPKGKRGLFTKDGVWHPAWRRNISAGEREGKEAHITYGSPSRPVFKFNFDIQVWQWLKHEDESFNGDEAWHIIPQSADAMKEFFIANQRRVIKNYLNEWIFK